MAGPGIVPKAALTASRAIYYPFTVPQKMNDSATLFGQEAHKAVMGVNAAVGGFYQGLKPRHGAEKVMGLFVKIQEAVPKSAAMAQRNKDVFWDPFTSSVEGIGRAVASPGAYWYLKSAGMQAPTGDAIKQVLNMGLFDYPIPAPPAAGGGDPGAAAAPSGPPAGAEQAAEGAGQTAQPQAA